MMLMLYLACVVGSQPVRRHTHNVYQACMRAAYLQVYLLPAQCEILRFEFRLPTYNWPSCRWKSQFLKHFWLKFHAISFNNRLARLSWMKNHCYPLLHNEWANIQRFQRNLFILTYIYLYCYRHQPCNKVITACFRLVTTTGNKGKHSAVSNKFIYIDLYLLILLPSSTL
jgi:hypothetical protein